MSAFPPASSPAVRRSMQGNRGRDTRPEAALRSAMHALGLRFFKHRRPLPGRRTTADAVFPRARVAVFLDGCFWHCCPEHGARPRTHASEWARDLDRNVERDRETDAALIEAGWLPLRFWEHEDPGECASRVRDVVMGRA